MNVTQLLTAQHVTYERDLEPANYGLDDCPFDTTPVSSYDFDDNIELPCNDCEALDPCGCLDRGGRFTHR